MATKPETTKPETTKPETTKPDTLTSKLREAGQAARTSPKPLADLIPLMQKAADELDRAKREIADLKERHDNIVREFKMLEGQHRNLKDALQILMRAAD